MSTEKTLRWSEYTAVTSSRACPVALMVCDRLYYCRVRQRSWWGPPEQPCCRTRRIESIYDRVAPYTGEATKHVPAITRARTGRISLASRTLAAPPHPPLPRLSNIRKISPTSR